MIQTYPSQYPPPESLSLRANLTLVCDEDGQAPILSQNGAQRGAWTGKSASIVKYIIIIGIRTGRTKRAIYITPDIHVSGLSTSFCKDSREAGRFAAGRLALNIEKNLRFELFRQCGTVRFAIILLSDALTS